MVNFQLPDLNIPHTVPELSVRFNSISEVTVHLFGELSSVLVHLAKKWTEFSSKFTISKKELSSVHERKNELFRSFYRSLKNHFKGDMPKSGSIYKSEVFLEDIFFANYKFWGKLEKKIFKNAIDPAFFVLKYAEILVFITRKWTQIWTQISVQVHWKSELSSVQVHLAKKWTKFSSKFTKKVNFWTELNFSVQFSHFTECLCHKMPKSFHKSISKIVYQV